MGGQVGGRAGRANRLTAALRASCPSLPRPRSKSGEVEGLEVRRRGLEAGMRERRSEVEMQLELMQARARRAVFHACWPASLHQGGVLLM